jgi:hypothetical protein
MLSTGGNKQFLPIPLRFFKVSKGELYEQKIESDNGCFYHCTGIDHARGRSGIKHITSYGW